MKRIMSVVFAVVLGAALSGCATGGTTQAAAPVEKKPGFDLKAAAIYTMEKAEDGELVDDSGNDMYAMVGGDFVQADGVVGKAMVFNGVDNFLKLPPEVQDGDGWTFAAWVNPDRWGDWARVFDMGDGRTSDIWMGFAGVEKRMRLDIFGTAPVATVLGNTLPPGKWSHIAGTLDGTTMCMYIDGELAMKVPATLLPKNVIKANSYVARSNWSADPLFIGKMDEIIIARTAYTQEQVQAIMKGIPVEK